jgi:hypothetical protein
MTNEPLFFEHRRLTGPVVTFGGASVIASVMLGVKLFGDGEAIERVLRYSIGMLVIGFALCYVLGRWQKVAFTTVRVDAQGLHVGSALLRADRIGEVTIVPSEMAGAIGLQANVPREGATPLKIPTDQSTYAIFGSTGRAVVVEQRPGRAWLLATRRPGQLAAALEAARDAAR